ncbi:MAG: hypothetical protein ACPGEC_00950 [Flavobacteriales bacterium]
MKLWLNYLILILLSATKFALTPLFSLQMDVSKTEVLTCMLVGGLTGYLLFYYFSAYLIQLFSKVRFGRKGKRKKTFRKRNRFIITVVRKYGLIVLALLTPVIFSIPVGAFLAARYFPKKLYINLLMCLGIVFWALLYVYLLPK